MAEYDPFDWETAHNPYPVYRWLRDEAPVYYNERLGFWALSRYDDVVAAHLNTDDFSSAHGVTIEGMEKDAPFLIVKDPPEHTAHRKIVGRLFTPRPGCLTGCATPTGSTWSRTSPSGCRST
jgi:cytochrome P450